MWYALYGAKAGWYRKDSRGEDFPSGKEIGEDEIRRTFVRIAEAAAL